MKYQIGVAPVYDDDSVGEMIVQEVEMLVDTDYYLPRILEAVIRALREDE